jgi:hypothetical protein
LSNLWNAFRPTLRPLWLPDKVPPHFIDRKQSQTFKSRVADTDLTKVSVIGIFGSTRTVGRADRATDPA